MSAPRTRGTSGDAGQAVPSVDGYGLVPAQPVAPAPAPVPPQPNYSAGYAPAPLLPQAPIVKSQSYAAPLSYVGSARRIGAAINRAGTGNLGLLVALWVLGVLAIGAAWMFVTCWYVVVFGLFGVFTFPFRLMRRSQRKSQHLQQVALATQQAMLLQQQQMLQQRGR